MKRAPTYFAAIRANATKRWEQLEGDPELAAPWRQLFMQVQSPHHVLSELLQNADDAGATEASARIENGTFVFEHNGGDFTEGHFASLCRFGYSNKRTLHTIGFRGIGFKTMFSIGDSVELTTPSLSVSFHRTRFTEPHWLHSDGETDGRTRISARISDDRVTEQVTGDFEHWNESPESLLFFRTLRRVKIGDGNVNWRILGPGPVTCSEWATFDGSDDPQLLLVHSTPEPFPRESLDEIRQERILDPGEEFELPPCTIDIVLGSKGRLFAVLPTGVETQLPFACNGPFVQDPSRMKIKDPEISPTNRWLLRRAGHLAADAMLGWLENPNLQISERAAAYSLLPVATGASNTLDGLCAKIVQTEIFTAINEKPLLLSESGKLARKNECIVIPAALTNAWSPDEACKYFDDRNRPILCQDVQASDRAKLLQWALVEEIDKHQALNTLVTKGLPKPETWRQLLSLWEYVAPEVTGYWPAFDAKLLRIVPVQGSDSLTSANGVVRLGERRILQSDRDWQFLADHVRVLNQNWTRFLAERRRISTEDDIDGRQAVEAAYAVLGKMGLDDTSDSDLIVEKVADGFYTQKNVGLQECIHLAQIAAKIGATVGSSFCFVTRDLQLRSSSDNVLFDADGTLEELIPPNERRSRLLHSRYAHSYTSCSENEWGKWVETREAGLLTFASIERSRRYVYGRARIEKEARIRGLETTMDYHYVTDQFVVEDWDFPDAYWTYWTELAADDDHVWMKIAKRILSLPGEYWGPPRSPRLLQVATTGTMKQIATESLLPNWAIRLRDFPCLPDTHGFIHRPDELFRRTPETESLIDVEPFVQGSLDTEATRELLDLLGVRHVPTGPDRLLDSLRALAESANPQLNQVARFCGRIDRFVDTCSTSDFDKIKRAFSSEKLILTKDNDWQETSSVVQTEDEEDVPGAPVIHPYINNLTLWRKIGVDDRPTLDLALRWLSTLPSGQVLAQNDVKRVQALQRRHARSIWDQSRHWLNLAGEWTPVDGLSYSLTMQSLIPWQHLFGWVKQKTADLRYLPADMNGMPPFAGLSRLAQCVDNRFAQTAHSATAPETKEWLKAFSAELRRVELETDVETSRIHGLAERLHRTRWIVSASAIEIIPYIDGTPAGTPRAVDVLWIDDSLYVDRSPKARLAKRVPEEIDKSIERSDVKTALDYCFERSPEDVRAYLRENFTLTEPTPQLDDTKANVIANAHEPSVPESQAPAPATAVLPEYLSATDSESSVVAGGENGDVILASTLPGNSEHHSSNDLDGPEVRARPVSKPAKPSILERFANEQGFRKNDDERYSRHDGSRISRTQGEIFPWVRRTPTGDPVRYYLPKDHCLQLEPLQIEAEVWALLVQQPDDYSLILPDTSGQPVEITGADLLAMRDRNEVTLYPAAYRIVYNHERNA